MVTRRPPANVCFVGVLLLTLVEKMACNTCLHQSQRLFAEKGIPVTAAQAVFARDNDNQSVALPTNDKPNIYEGISPEDARYINENVRRFLTKKWRDYLVPWIQEYLHTEFKWGKDNEVVDVLRAGCSVLWESLVPYHEVVEWLSHGGEEDTWDHSHPIAIEMTGNALKQKHPRFSGFCNVDIHRAIEHSLHGTQLTGNPLLDDSRYGILHNSLTPAQKDIVFILDELWNKEPLFTDVESLLLQLRDDFAEFAQKHTKGRWVHKAQ